MLCSGTQKQLCLSLQSSSKLLNLCRRNGNGRDNREELIMVYASSFLLRVDQRYLQRRDVFTFKKMSSFPFFYQQRPFLQRDLIEKYLLCSIFGINNVFCCWYVCGWGTRLALVKAPVSSLGKQRPMLSDCLMFAVRR